MKPVIKYSFKSRIKFSNIEAIIDKPSYSTYLPLNSSRVYRKLVLERIDRIDFYSDICILYITFCCLFCDKFPITFIC